MEQLSDGERYHEARWRRDRLRALAEAVLRQRTADALAGVALAAARPAGPGAVTVVRLVDGRLTGSAACAEGEAIRVAHGLPTTAPDGGDPFAVAAERALLARWLTSGGTRLLWAEGAYAQPVAGGLLLDDVVSRIRRRRTTDRAADELYDKRLRRRSA
jgi:DNA polymerase-3 subunit epsilon